MARRLELHEELCSNLGSRNVYFQPPASVKIKYDPTGAIVYKIADRNDLKADDIRYRGMRRYEVTFITRDPDSEIPDKLLDYFQYIRHERSYPADNLHHDVFTIYY